MNGRTLVITLALALCVTGMPPAGAAGPAKSEPAKAAPVKAESAKEKPRSTLLSKMIDCRVYDPKRSQ